MNRSEFAKQIAKLAAAYREQVDAPTIEVYYEMLEPYDGELAQAVIEAIEDSPRFPSIADLRIRCMRIRREQRERIPRLPPHEEPIHVKELVNDLKQRMGWI